MAVFAGVNVSTVWALDSSQWWRKCLQRPTVSCDWHWRNVDPAKHRV